MEGIYKSKKSGMHVQVTLCDDEMFPCEVKDLNGALIDRYKERFLSKDFEFVGKQIPIKPMPTIEPKEDLIHKPNHYHKNEIDVNGYLEKHFPKEANVTVAEGFYIGNVIKYVSRHKEKGKLQDLEKAMANLNKLIELNRQ